MSRDKTNRLVEIFNLIRLILNGLTVCLKDLDHFTVLQLCHQSLISSIN